MRLEKLHLVNFKNYAEVNVDFRGAVHCLLGKNGSGKTNLLEAIHYLSFTRGSMPIPDSSCIRHGHDQFSIRGLFRKNEKQFEVACSFSGERKKMVTENGKEYGRFSDHIGKYPLVLVAPNDIELIWDGGEVRRRFFDTLLAQLDKGYLEHLIVYQSSLRQRNGLLRMFSERGVVDRDLIDSYDEKIVASGNFIFQKRLEFSGDYQPRLASHYDFLVTEHAEKAEVTYESGLKNTDFKKELSTKLEGDILLGRTTVGIHRDDFLFTLNGHELKRFGSQGQQKSFLIALKLAEFDCLKKKNGFKPLLLLDDIFDKLDDDRIHQLMQAMMEGAFGQIFITDARPGRSRDVLREAGVKSQNFFVDNGSLAEL